ncbi:MAG: YkgJ family cysteine cluster protein, partial [Chitinophagaceae bacterium]
YRRRINANRKAFRSFIRKSEANPPRLIHKILQEIEPKVWDEVECLSCANCCKKMTPTFTEKDLKRISAYFEMTPEAFRKKWLRKDRNKDLVNKTEPCQFLNLSDNKCSIYAIRPADCAGFPHLAKTRWTEYAHVHLQNIDYCPATYKMVEKLMMNYSSVHQA